LAFEDFKRSSASNRQVRGVNIALREANPALGGTGCLRLDKQKNPSFHPVSRNQSRRGGTSLVILHPNEPTKTLAQTEIAWHSFQDYSPDSLQGSCYLQKSRQGGLDINFKILAYEDIWYPLYVSQLNLMVSPCAKAGSSSLDNRAAPL
jgi:hypothetical protein